jgi:hypothetical protein
MKTARCKRRRNENGALRAAAMKTAPCGRRVDLISKAEQ